MTVENAYIKLPLGIFRKDAIISIRCTLDEIDNGAFKNKQLLPGIYIYTINGLSLGYNCTSIEDRDAIYNECVKILTTNN